MVTIVNFGNVSINDYGNGRVNGLGNGSITNALNGNFTGIIYSCDRIASAGPCPGAAGNTARDTGADGERIVAECYSIAVLSYGNAGIFLVEDLNGQGKTSVVVIGSARDRNSNR